MSRLHYHRNRWLYRLAAVLTLCAGLCVSAGETPNLFAGFCSVPAAAQPAAAGDALLSQGATFAPLQLIDQNPALPNGCSGWAASVPFRPDDAHSFVERSRL